MKENQELKTENQSKEQKAKNTQRISFLPSAFWRVASILSQSTNTRRGGWACVSGERASKSSIAASSEVTSMPI